MTRELKDALLAVKDVERLVRSINDELSDANSALKAARARAAKLRRSSKN